MIEKHRTPDASTIGGGSNGAITLAPADTHTRHMGNVPKKDADLLNVSTLASAKWAASPAFTLTWKTQAAFAAEVAAFKDELEDRNTAGGKKSQQTHDLEFLDSQAEDAVSFVKTYIAGKFGPADAKAHYAEFGLVHRHYNYELPTDRQRRLDALRMMVDAIHANGFDANQYGQVFWTDLKTNYASALSVSQGNTGGISAHVSNLTLMRTGLRRVLHSLLLLIEANYPDTHHQEARDWGFQKENY